MHVQNFLFQVMPDHWYQPQIKIPRLEILEDNISEMN